MKPIFTSISLLCPLVLAGGIMTAGGATGWALDQMGAEMIAVPVPQGTTVKIDGNLSDWDLSAQEWVAVSAEVADRFSGHVAVMYDDEALYLSVDAATGGGPLNNPNQPSERPWQGHSVEFRCIASPDAPFPFTAKSPRTEPHPNQKFYSFCNSVRLFEETITKTPYLVIQPGPPYGPEQQINPPGAAVAFTERKNPDRYVMEARVPWKSLGVTSGRNPFKPGEKMTAFWTILWPQMRVEFLSTAPTGGFGWADYYMKDWGQIRFSPQGHLPQRHGTMAEYLTQQESATDKGTAFEINLPAALKTSVSIFDKAGHLVRELIGGEPRPAGKSRVYWDGYDWRGNPLPLGEYTWKAYASPGLKPVFLGPAGTGGEPPYNTADGKGGWGGDHGQPIGVAADDTGVYFLWDNNEAAKAFVKVGYDDKNLWRNNAFVQGGFGPYTACASNGKHFYVIWGGKKTYLARFNCATGLAEPFRADMPYVLVNDCQMDQNPVNAFFSFETETNPKPETIGVAATAMAVYATTYSKHKIFVFDAETGAKLRELDCPWPRGLCVDKNGDVFVISADINRTSYYDYTGVVLRFAKGQGPGQPVFQLYGLGAPWGIAVDAQGRFFVTDAGYSNQIWVYQNRAHVGWIGRQGGRPDFGHYDQTGMLHPTGVAVDARGHILVAQMAIPSVFQRFAADTLAVDKEWFGDTAYGPPAWPSAKDPLTVYMRYKEGAQFVRARLKGDGSSGPIDAYWDLNKMGLPAPFTCSQFIFGIPANVIGPHGIEFLFTDSANRPYNAHLIFRVDGDRLIPAAYIRGTGSNPRAYLNEPVGLELWSDLNHNGKVEENEIVRVAELAGQKLEPGFISMDSLWMNARCDLFLAHASNRIFKIPARSVDKEGAIIWDVAKASVQAADVIPGLPSVNTAPREGILGMRDDGAGNLYTCFNVGNYAKFPYATKEWSEALKPGLGHSGNFNVVKVEKFGPAGQWLWMAGRKATGTAKPGEMYHTWIMAGLVGAGYPAVASEWTPVSFYSPDGFFVDSVMGDPNRGGAPDAYHIGGGENFTGRVVWFGDRGECYLYTGNAHSNVYRIDGFDKDGQVAGEIRFTGKMKLDRHVNPYPPGVDAPKPPVEIVRLADPFDTKRWGDQPAVLTGNNGEELARINVGYDDTNLYARFEVKDATPMENKADDEKLLFKWGDCVGLYFGRPGKHDQPQAGDIRLLAAEFKGRPVVVAMIPELATLHRPTEYFTPAGGRWKFAFVGVLDGATARFTKQPNAGYTAELKIPLEVLAGLTFKPGEKLACEAEVLLSGFGQRGFQTMARNHLFTPRSAVSAKMVDDIPSEARLYPQYWGVAEIK